MKKLALALAIMLPSFLVMAEQPSWYETTKDSYIFIKKNSIEVDEKQPHLKTLVMSVNIPSIKERKADPSKTALKNETAISYVSDITVNCTDKTSQIGKQTIYEGLFGNGKVLESADKDPNSKFTPLAGINGEAIWTIACQPKK